MSWPPCRGCGSTLRPGSSTCLICGPQARQVLADENEFAPPSAPPVGYQYQRALGDVVIIDAGRLDHVTEDGRALASAEVRHALPMEFREHAGQVVDEINRALQAQGLPYEATFSFERLLRLPDPPAGPIVPDGRLIRKSDLPGLWRAVSGETDYEPELPQDPTGVDCFERYESPAEGM